MLITGWQQQDWGAQYGSDGQWIQLDESGQPAALGDESGTRWAWTPNTASTGDANPVPPVAPEPAPLPQAVPAPAPAPVRTVPMALTAAPRTRSPQEWSQITSTWFGYQGDPYRLYQQMSEHGWTAADMAYASGLSEQAVGDQLTRWGVPAGFGGAVTLGRDAVLQPFLAELNQAVSSPNWWRGSMVKLDENGNALRSDESGNVVMNLDGNGNMIASFDLAGFMQWYASQDSSASRDFVRIAGGWQADSGGLRFDSGLVVSPGGYNESGMFNASSRWDMDGRIAQYASFPTMNPLEQAAMRVMLDTPINRELVNTLGSSAELPNNELGERMRALYGSESAQWMMRVTDVTDRLKGDYLSALNAARGTGVIERYAGIAEPTQPWWVAMTSWVDESGNVHQPYRFDDAVFYNDYIRQPAASNRLLGKLFGEGHNVSSGMQTSGTSEQWTVGYSATPTVNESGDESGSATSSVAEDQSLSSDLVRVNLSSPPNLFDSGQVVFRPGVGFVTSTANIKPPEDDDWFGQLFQVGVMAAAAWFSAGTLGPAAASAMGLSGTVATVASAAVAGAATSAVGGALNGDLTLKGVLKGALSGALTAGLLQQLPLDKWASASDWGRAAGVVARAGVQGSVQALTGGSFTEGAVAGLASGLGSSLSDTLNANIEAALRSGQVDKVGALALRYSASTLVAAVEMVARGEDHLNLASAYLSETAKALGLDKIAVDPPEASLSPAAVVQPVNLVMPESGVMNELAPLPEMTPADVLAGSVQPPSQSIVLDSDGWDLSSAPSGDTQSWASGRLDAWVGGGLSNAKVANASDASASSDPFSWLVPSPSYDAWLGDEAFAIDDPASMASEPRPVDLGQPSSDAPLDRESVGSTPAQVVVGKGDTIEGIARRLFGERWREGVGQLMLSNDLRINAQGSPIVREGQTLQLSPLESYADDELALLSRYGGAVISRNTNGLALKAAQEARQRELAAQALSPQVPTGSDGTPMAGSFSVLSAPMEGLNDLPTLALLMGSGSSADPLNSARKDAEEQEFMRNVTNRLNAEAAADLKARKDQAWSQIYTGGVGMLTSGLLFGASTLAAPATGGLSTFGITSGGTAFILSFDQFVHGVGYLAAGWQAPTAVGSLIRAVTGTSTINAEAAATDATSAAIELATLPRSVVGLIGGWGQTPNVVNMVGRKVLNQSESLALGAGLGAESAAALRTGIRSTYNTVGGALSNGISQGVDALTTYAGAAPGVGAYMVRSMSVDTALTGMSALISADVAQSKISGAISRASAPKDQDLSQVMTRTMTGLTVESLTGASPYASELAVTAGKQLWVIPSFAASRAALNVPPSTTVSEPPSGLVFVPPPVKIVVPGADLVRSSGARVIEPPKLFQPPPPEIVLPPPLYVPPTAVSVVPSLTASEKLLSQIAEVNRIASTFKPPVKALVDLIKP